jgi:1-deoxy-D-xylulose-5-phosphate synthase
MTLEKVNFPSDIRHFDLNELKVLSEDIRKLILNVISKNGGHLASSLGATELTVALHYVFDTPNDKIIWDVGHQAYAHKILTGRKDSFSSIRKENGISGFPKISESEYDAFGVGHSSTSISAALGIASARDLNGLKFKVVAVIGDGALTGGEALEGLNNAGYLDKDILVILNDNRMSISTNVGALAEHAKRIKNTQAYKEVKLDYHKIRESLPDQCLPYLDDLKKHLYTLLTPEVLFTKLGFDYYGPIDGHDMGQLIENMKNINQKSGPKLLHIVTKKGKGYEFAEVDSEAFHGVSSFNLSTGKKANICKQLTYSESFGDVIVDLAKDNEKIIAITAAMPTGTGLEPFSKQFPKRFFDVGIAEQHAVTFAAGLATQGFIPIVAIYSTFLQRAYDQVIHDVCLQNLHVIFAIDRAGIVGDDGPTHNGQFDLSFLSIVPNLIVASPMDEKELQDLFYSAIKYQVPTAIRYPRGYGTNVCINNEYDYIKPGKSKTLIDGEDIVIVGIGSTVNIALEAAKALIDSGFSVKMINARFAKPICQEMIKSINKIGKVVIIEENSLIGGLGMQISTLVRSKIEIIAIPDRFIEQADTKKIKEKYGLSKENIIECAKKLLMD